MATRKFRRKIGGEYDDAGMQHLRQKQREREQRQEQIAKAHVRRPFWRRLINRPQQPAPERPPPLESDWSSWRKDVPIDDTTPMSAYLLIESAGSGDLNILKENINILDRITLDEALKEAVNNDQTEIIKYLNTVKKERRYIKGGRKKKKTKKTKKRKGKKAKKSRGRK